MPNPSPGLQKDPRHTITIAPHPRTVTISFGEVVVASTKEALELREAGHPPVLYVPFRDIYFEHLMESPTSTRCPFKGQASYWSVTGQGEAATDVMWAYQHPYDEVLAIREHGAFDPSRMRVDA